MLGIATRLELRLPDDLRRSLDELDELEGAMAGLAESLPESADAGTTPVNLTRVEEEICGRVDAFTGAANRFLASFHPRPPA